MILRLYGESQVIHPLDEAWSSLLAHFPEYVGARQIFDLKIELVQTSCGFAVPFFEFSEERDTLTKWAEKKGEDGIKAYWTEKNQTTIDGFETHIVEKGIG